MKTQTQISTWEGIRTDFIEFKGERLPKNAIAFLNDIDAFRSKVGTPCLAFYKGDLLTTSDWIIVMDDGFYYKVGAEYMTWYRDEKGEIRGKANWSGYNLKRCTLDNLLQGRPIKQDPNYQS